MRERGGKGAKKAEKASKPKEAKPKAAAQVFYEPASELLHASTGGALQSGPLPCFFFTLVSGPRRSLRLDLSDTRVYEPQIRARQRLHAFCTEGV